jgi:hypothetical protein
MYFLKIRLAMLTNTGKSGLPESQLKISCFQKAIKKAVNYDL